MAQAVGDAGQADAVHGWVAHDVFDRLQFGYVLARFQRHIDVGVFAAAACGEGAADGAIDVALSPVVGGQCQMPVAVHIVQALQIIQCGAGRGHYVVALIGKAVLLQ